MQTVLCFDSWTGGARHYERLVSACADYGLRLVLVHIGSWGHDRGRPSEERLGELPVRDIECYGDRLENVLDAEQPCAVLFLSTRAFAHQAMNLYARRRGIPTVHLLHGLVSVQAGLGGGAAYEASVSRLVLGVLTRGWKNVSRLLPVYVESLIRTRAAPRVWRGLIREVIGKARGASEFLAPAGAQTTAGMVYTDADVAFLRDCYGVPAERIFVVGNPDLLQFGLSAHDYGAALASTAECRSEIIYIETALMKAGFVFPRAESYVAHICETALAASEAGLKLAVKVHPATATTSIPGLLRERGIDLVDGAAFLPRLRGAAGALVEPSTAALIPALMGLPLLLAQYGRLAGQRYGPVLTSYPRAAALNDLGRVGEVLLEIWRADRSVDFADWISANAGPLPAEEMPQRVAGALRSVMRGEAASL